MNIRPALRGLDRAAAFLRHLRGHVAREIGVEKSGSELDFSSRLLALPPHTRKFNSDPNCLELKQQLVEMQGDLRIARVTLEEGGQSIRAQQDRRNELVAGFSATTHDELRKALQRAAALEKELAKAEERHRLKALRAPADGFVQQLAIHTIGGVVNPGDPLMVVVPHDTVIEVEAQILNKDIGFVRAGQLASIKVESFPFTKDGLINGEVTSVSADAIQDKDKGLVYAARVAMKEKRILVDDKWVSLGPGMAVTVEVKTGERRVVEYFLSPFIKYGNEAIRER